MNDSEETEFRQITRAFLKKEWKESFEIFCKNPSDADKQFTKFAEFDPSDSSRLDSLLQDGDVGLYINETDLYKYYQFNVLKHLLLDLLEEERSAWEVFRMVYPVATSILQDYHDISASDTFLELLDEFPEVLAESQESGNPPFFELYAITQKDHSIHTHCVNVGMYCLCLARELGMDCKVREEIARGGMLADIGKKFIPRDLLLKEGELTDQERHTLQQHAVLGKKKLHALKRYSNTVIQMAAEHHENFDGTGYPMRIAGKQISMAARICKIADVFNALTNQRPYGKTMSPKQALMHMNKDLKGQFDPDMLSAFILYAVRQ